MTEVSPELAHEIKITQEMLGKYISQPPLLDQTLSMPPFKFIHEIVVNVIQETGFMAGYFSDEELKSSVSLSTYDKWMFLNQLIITAMEATGESKEVFWATKILTGKEPEKTNKLLQLIARGIQAEINSGRAKTKLEAMKRSEIWKKNKAEEAQIATRASRSKANFEQKLQNPPGLTSKTNQASTCTSSSKTTSKDTESSKGEESSGTKRNRMNPSPKKEFKIKNSNNPSSRSTKNQPDPKVNKPSSETKPLPAKEFGRKNPRTDANLNPTSCKTGQRNTSQKQVIERGDGDKRDDGCMARSSVKVLSKNLANRRSSARLAQIAKSASNISGIQELYEGTRPSMTLENDPLCKKTFIPEKSNLQNRPVTRSGFLMRHEDDNLIVRKLDRKSTSQIKKEVKSIEFKEALPEPDSLAMLWCDVIDSEISGGEEAHNNLYDQLCNPKPTTTNGLDISDNEKSEIIDLNQIGSDVSVCQSGYFTSGTENVGDFYQAASHPEDDDEDTYDNILRAIESTASNSTILEVTENLILESEATNLRDQVQEEQIPIMPTGLAQIAQGVYNRMSCIIV